MNRDRDFDQTLTRWLDDGADLAPERYVWAALESVDRTGQRGAHGALLEATIMKLKPAAPMLGVVAVVLLAIVAYQLLGRNVGGPQPTPTPNPRAYTAQDLPNIVTSSATAPDGMVVDGTTTDVAALIAPEHPGGPTFDRSRMIDALMTNLDSTEFGGFVSWGAIFDSVESAQAAYDVLVATHATSVGWGMESWASSLAFGEESASYQGAAYDFETARVHVWRVGTLLLAAVAVGDVAEGDANAGRLRALADGMNERSR